MTLFRGRLREYPSISLDCFDNENLHARAYFLSHCHKDHMKGLKSTSIRQKLETSSKVRLYCSTITKKLLLTNPKHSFWEHYIVALEVENPTQICLDEDMSGEKESILVTLLPAGHCPGSVMFLIEGTQGAVLYTGDFRLAQDQVSQMAFLHTGSRVKDIKSVYLDTTFFDPQFFHIPSREACVNGIRELVRDWISVSPYHVVWLNCKSAYGYECLFLTLCKEFGCQIHMRSAAMFQNIPEIHCHMTTNPATQLHACAHTKGEESLKSSGLPCGTNAPDGTPLRVITITPSTMWFGETSMMTKIIIRTGPSSYRACFSFHSSYSEIKDFLSYLRPVNIYPNVVPAGKTLQDVQEILKPFCRAQGRAGSEIYRPLGTLKRPKVERLVEDNESDLFDHEDLSPWRRKIRHKGEDKHCRSPAPERSSPTSRFPNVNSHLKNILDCAESSSDEEGDDEDSGLVSSDSPADLKAQGCEEQRGTSTGQPDSKPLTWEAFFTPDPLPADEENDPEGSHGTQAVSVTSQSPDLFRDSDNDSSYASSQSTNISEPATDSQLDTVLIWSEESSVHKEDHRDTVDETHNVYRDKGLNEGIMLTVSEGHKSESQDSSDFDIPPSPRISGPLAGGPEGDLQEAGHWRASSHQEEQPQVCVKNQAHVPCPRP